MSTATTTNAGLVERQVAGFNAGSIDDVVSMYSDDAVLVVVSPHTLPGSELRIEGVEKITRHMQRVLDGGIAGVQLHWLSEGNGTLSWHDTGSFGADTAFSEAHLAKLNSDGQVVEHWIHSVYAR